MLEWVAMPSSRGSFQPRDWTQVSRIAGRVFTIWATRQTQWPRNFTAGYITKKIKKLQILIQKDTCTIMFIAALCIIAKIWKHSNCPSTDEWIKKIWYIYHNGILLSHKKDEILPSVATWMDLEGIMLKWNKQNIERQILHAITSIIEPEKYNKVVNITKNEQTDRYREQASGQSGEGGGRQKLLGIRQAQGCTA